MTPAGARLMTICWAGRDIRKLATNSEIIACISMMLGAEALSQSDFLNGLYGEGHSREPPSDAPLWASS